jgi:hypothetical protein
MRQRRQSTINDLRRAVDCLPRDTKVAMLTGITNNPIIVGAYADGDGICPMLAAHRAGGRTSFISFARAWDGFAFREKRGKRARRATERELLVLRAHLETSLMQEDGPAPDLVAAVSEHRRLKRQHAFEDVMALTEEERRRLDNERSRRQGQREAKRRSRREHPRVRPGDPDRSSELSQRDGWAWTRVVRRYDDYERALQRLEQEHAAIRSDEHSAIPERERELTGS